MKNITIFSIFLCFSVTLSAQVVEVEKSLREEVKTDSVLRWTHGGVFNFGLSQTSFSNWAAGGQNSIAGNSLFSVFANYKSPRSAWDNQLDISYGIMKQEDTERAQKTDDKIDLVSKYGYKAGKDFYYAVLASFKTQSMPGYKSPLDSIKTSDFLAPAYFLVAAGMDYKPNNKITVFMAPVTLKTTIVNSTFLADQGAYGVEPAFIDDAGILVPGKKKRTEFGGYLRVFYKDQYFKNIDIQSKLDLFSNYLNNPGNIDVNWEVLLAFKVTKYISTTISTQLIYDDDIITNIDKDKDGVFEESGPRIQFKEIISVGFSYKF
jgi:hypothetical protein